MSTLAMPRLSESLLGPKAPNACQRCGIAGDANTVLTRWRECDDNDQPETVVVVLCQRCADKVIEPHPRLYHEIAENAPWPGAMAICLECRHREGTRCTQAKINGGPGGDIIIIGPKPTRVHVCRSPRRLSGWLTLWPGPPRDCSRREVVEATR